MVKKKSKNSTGKQNLYLSILNELDKTTDLSKIQKNVSISKQKLNYYLREMKNKGMVIHKGRGWYEVAKSSKNSTKHGKHLNKDSIRGHAYVWEIKLPKEIEGWNNRIERLKQKNINFIRVGALKTTPRIKVMGRKVWLCNNHIRIYDKKDMSYYGTNAINSRKLAFQEFLLIVGVLERKLGVSLRPLEFEWRKEHYALIKNDLAIQENRKGNQWHIKDEFGEWLLIDDSLEKGGELETIGNKSFETNIPLAKFWNNLKKDNFKTADPENLKKKFKEIDINLNETVDRIVKSSQLMLDSEMRWKQLENRIRGQEVLIYQLVEEIRKWKK